MGKEFQAIKELLPKLTEFKGKLGDSADNLLEALQYEDEISMRLGKLYTYAHMRYASRYNKLCISSIK